jgi:hypothetical protein
MNSAGQHQLREQHILFLDPGKLTGYAKLDDGQFFRSGECSAREVGGIVEGHCETQCTAVIGWEKFDIMPQTWMMKGSAETIEVIGVIKYVGQKFGAIFTPPVARQAKKQVPDGMLKAMGWHRPGHGGHANDAARLLLSWMIAGRFLSLQQHDTVTAYLKESRKAETESAVRGD